MSAERLQTEGFEPDVEDPAASNQPAESDEPLEDGAVPDALPAEDAASIERASDEEGAGASPPESPRSGSKDSAPPESPPHKETRKERKRRLAEEAAAAKASEEAEAKAAAAHEQAGVEETELAPEPEVEVKRPRLRWKKKEMPPGLFIKCEACSATIFRKELVEKGMVCPGCGFHFTLGGPERIQMVLDEGTWEELFAGLETLDRLAFTDKISYAEKIAKTVERLGQKEALFLGTGAIEGRPLVLAVLDFKFMGGSMGEVVGEKIALAVELALDRRLPLVIFTSSGGARMHEGMLSLMQMAKTCAALQTMREQGGFSICIMTNPTTGGVTASFASVCDVILAEPGALIGFAGPRVIATTLKQDLPKGFQRAEFLLEKGQLDRIVPRGELRSMLARLIDFGRLAWQ